MNYYNLENSQAETSVKRSKMTRIALLSLLIVGMFGVVVYFNDSGNQNSLVVPNMLYMSSQNNDVVITTSRNMTVCSSQGGDGIPDAHQQCTTYNSVQDIIAQNTGAQDIMNVFIVYKELNSTSEFDPSGNLILDESDYKPLLEEEIDLIFKATVTVDGTLLGLYAPKNHTYSELVVRLTERLIEQYFPQLSLSLYNSPRSLLSQSLPSHVENSYLGTVTPSFSYDMIDESHYSLTKTYRDEDFIDFHYSLGGEMPDIDYSSNFIIKDGKVEVNKEIMTFNINYESQKLRANQNDRIPISPNKNSEYIELIGQSNSKIESTMQIISTASNPQLIADIFNYEMTYGFSEIDLKENSGKLNILRGGEVNNSTLLSDAEPFISKSYDIFRHSIVGNTVSLSIDYKNYESYSDISSSIYLNELNIYTIYKTSIQHPWFACSGFQKGDNRNQKLKIFEVVYPLLGGILNIPVTASIQVDYGWNFTVGANGANCDIEFKPYVNPSFEVTGAIQVWKVAEGGVFARGNVANTYVDFLLSIDRKALQLLFTVDAKLIPFQYNIGAYYQYITCNVKKIFQNIFKFKWGEICSMSDKHEVPLLQGQLLDTVSYRIHAETKALLSVN